MKKSLYLIAAVAALVSCTKENAQVVSEASYLGATIVKEDGKTALTPTAVNWSEGDKIAVVCDGGIEECTLAEGAGTPSGKFSFTGTNPVYAVYPFDGTSVAGTTATVKIAASQQYPKTDSFASNLAVMAGKVSGSSVSFHNACAVLEVKLKGEGFVKYITVSSATKNLAGDCTIDLTSDSPVATVIDNANAKKSVTLSVANGGVELSSTDTKFYIVLAPGDYDDLSISVNYDATKSSSKSHSLRAGHVTPLSSMSMSKVSAFSYSWTPKAATLKEANFDWTNVSTTTNGTVSGKAFDTTGKAYFQFIQKQKDNHYNGDTATNSECTFPSTSSIYTYQVKYIWTGDHIDFTFPEAELSKGTCINFSTTSRITTNAPHTYFLYSSSDGFETQKEASAVYAPKWTGTSTMDTEGTLRCTFYFTSTGANSFNHTAVLTSDSSSKTVLRVSCASGAYVQGTSTKQSKTKASALRIIDKGATMTITGYKLKFD